jgi:hypothetical protein
MSIFKKKMTADQIGGSLASLWDHASQSDTTLRMLEDAFGFDGAEKRDRAKLELRYLNAFSCAFASLTIFGIGLANRNVLDSFYNCILHPQSSHGMVPEDLKARIDTYVEASQTPHHNGPGWNVARTFVAACGQQPGLHNVMFGTMQFNALFTGAKKMLNTVKLQY